MDSLGKIPEPRPENLPDFLLIGAPKAGSTAFFNALCRHPGVYGSPHKEPRFFMFPNQNPVYDDPRGNTFVRGAKTSEAGYRELFAGAPPGAVRGEASINYLAYAEAAQNAFHWVPGARLIALLRHPVERAFSGWLHARLITAAVDADFETAWHQEAEHKAANWGPAWEFRDQSFYARQLRNWLKYFPREQLLILFYEDWSHAAGETLARAWQHLGLKPLDTPSVTRDNVTSRRAVWRKLYSLTHDESPFRTTVRNLLPLKLRSAISKGINRINERPTTTLDPELRRRLAKEYWSDIDELEKLTGRDLTAWRT